MRDGLIVFLIFNIFLAYNNLFNRKYLKLIIGSYLVNSTILTLIFYAFSSYLKIGINLFWVIVTIIFSIIYGFIRSSKELKDEGMSLKALIVFTSLYTLLDLITCAILYFQGNINNYNCILIIVLTVQIILNYCIRFLSDRLLGGNKYEGK